MSQHIIQVTTPKHGEVEIIIGWDGACREFFGTALTSEENSCYHSAPREALSSIKAAILSELGVELPLTMIAGTEQDQRDHQAGQFVGRREVIYDPNGVVVQRNDH